MANHVGSYSPEATRRELLDVALRLIGERGFDGTPVALIVEQAGVTKGAFYHHFSSKEDVLRQIHHSYASEMLAGAQEVRDSDEEPIVMLRAFIRNAVVTFGRFRSHVAVFYQEFRSLSKDSFDSVRDLHDREEAILVGIIDEAIAAGQLRSDVDAKLLVFAISGVSAWLHRWYDERGSRSIDDIAAGLAAIILDGVTEPALR